MSDDTSVARRPTLTLFCGLPGSGKTTLARRLEAEGIGIRLATDEWQADIGVPHTNGDLHERLQARLYGHALTLLRAGVDVILEDGLWMAHERAAKFADARSIGATISMHVFDVDFDELWSRIQRRNEAADVAAAHMTEEELRTAWRLFEPMSPEELASVDAYTRHGGGLTTLPAAPEENRGG